MQAAFLIPIIASIVLEQAKNPLVKVPRPRALILVPTRELACQIQKTAVQIAFDTGVTCLAVYGAIDSEYIQQRLSAGYDIIVGTPGRVLDVIQRKLVSLNCGWKQERIIQCPIFFVVSTKLFVTFPLSLLGSIQCTPLICETAF